MEYPRGGGGLNDTSKGHDAEKKDKPKGLPVRFYKTATVVDTHNGYEILLDQRTLKTPKRETLRVPTLALAEAIRDEWDAQLSHIDPELMPLNKFSNTTTDGISGKEREIVDAIASFIESDLVCYRADAPCELVSLQVNAWEPLLQWAHEDLGFKLATTTGVMPVEQPSRAKVVTTNLLKKLNAFELAAIHVLTTLTGSLIIALAVSRHHIDHAEAWAKAHVDEDYQLSQWGEDSEAAKRRVYNLTQFSAAHQLLLHLR